MSEYIKSFSAAYHDIRADSFLKRCITESKYHDKKEKHHEKCVVPYKRKRITLRIKAYPFD